MKGDLAAIQILKADAGVNALASVFPFIAPEGAAVPYIVVNSESIEPTRSKSTSSGLDTDTILLEMVHTDYESLISLTDAVRAAMDEYTGTITVGSTSLNVHRCYFLSSGGGYAEKETSITYYVIEFTYVLEMRRTPDYTT